jgi:hypothetical protein
MSPDGKRSVTLKTWYVFPDWTIRMKVRESSWFMKEVYASGDVPKPGYTEAFWDGNLKVHVLECNSGKLLSYDFSSNTFSELDFVYVEAKLAERNVHPNTRSGKRTDSFCESKGFP